MAAGDIASVMGVNLFMPVVSFLFVAIITYLILLKTAVLGGSKGLSLFISFIIAIIFMSFSSLDLYVRTITPWAIVLLVVVFLVLLVMGFATGDVKKIMASKFMWLIGILLVIVFLVSAIKVFNPVFHNDLVITSGEAGSPGVVSQIREFLASSNVAGSILLLIVAGAASWVLTKGAK